MIANPAPPKRPTTAPAAHLCGNRLQHGVAGIVADVGFGPLEMFDVAVDEAERTAGEGSAGDLQRRRFVRVATVEHTAISGSQIVCSRRDR